MQQSLSRWAQVSFYEVTDLIEHLKRRERIFGYGIPKLNLYSSGFFFFPFVHLFNVQISDSGSVDSVIRKRVRDCSGITAQATRNRKLPASRSEISL